MSVKKEVEIGRSKEKWKAKYLELKAKYDIIEEKFNKHLGITDDKNNNPTLEQNQEKPSKGLSKYKLKKLSEAQESSKILKESKDQEIEESEPIKDAKALEPEIKEDIEEFDLEIEKAPIDEEELKKHYDHQCSKCGSMFMDKKFKENNLRCPNCQEDYSGVFK